MSTRLSDAGKRAMLEALQVGAKERSARLIEANIDLCEALAKWVKSDAHGAELTSDIACIALQYALVVRDMYPLAKEEMLTDAALLRSQVAVVES